jgi:late competence protein required for DNA uptake (superfamily II DNA/RNA helicase)
LLIIHINYPGVVNFKSAQKEASDAAVQFIRESSNERKELLIWAVTGAGKTEVVFQAIYHALNQNKKILIATPRKDVVLELTPRLKSAFPNTPIISLHGDSIQKGEIGSLVIATTHQAINFYQYFDLVIVDEVDAYPFHNNPMLHLAVDRAAAKDGQKIYLTATPPRQILQRVREGRAHSVRIPVRHHGYPLVVPQLIIDSKLGKQLKNRQLPKGIKKFINHLLQSGRQGFLFVPRIDMVDPLVTMIRDYLTDYQVGKRAVPNYAFLDFFKRILTDLLVGSSSQMKFSTAVPKLRKVTADSLVGNKFASNSVSVTEKGLNITDREVGSKSLRLSESTDYLVGREDLVSKKYKLDIDEKQDESADGKFGFVDRGQIPDCKVGNPKTVETSDSTVGNYGWVEGTFSSDPDRGRKVQAFRDGMIWLLVTTTILERGVTIPGTDCLVCNADVPIFDESSLVQIAGRVGRSRADPSGTVIFLSESKTNGILRAIKQIKQMNRLAKKRGYLSKNK